jgi:Periplasmic binding protein
VFDTRALAVGTAQEVVKRGGDSWFFITDDYAFGHSLERDASAVVLKNGGKVLGSVKPPFATPDLSSFILQAQAKISEPVAVMVSSVPIGSRTSRQLGLCTGLHPTKRHGNSRLKARSISAHFGLHYCGKSGLFREWICAERNSCGMTNSMQNC